MRNRLTLLAAVLSLLPAPALAWGQTGHRVVGAIAEHYLSGPAQGAVTAILGHEDLAEAANWPDFMRSDPDPFWEKTSVPWHWVTVPADKGYTLVGAPPEGDAYTALQRFSKTLRDPKASLADRTTALRFVIHLVGDLHQPLHAGRPGDRGGNAVVVTWFGERTNLHTVWDSKIIDNEQLSWSEMADWLGRRITPEQLTRWNTPDPLVWISESVAVRERIYPVDPALSYAYVYMARPIVDEQLEKAGVRLAAYLNVIFAPQGTPARK